MDSRNEWKEDTGLPPLTPWALQPEVIFIDASIGEEKQVFFLHLLIRSCQQKLSH